MTTRNPHASGHLSREERQVWWDAYLATYQAALPNNGQLVTDRTLDGQVRIAVKGAWASLEAFRTAARGVRQ